MAGSVNLDIIERESLVARALEIETELIEALAPLLDHPLVSEIRGGLGAMATVQLDPEAVHADETLAPRAADASREAGVITRALADGAL